jgi:hypothetical protein
MMVARMSEWKPIDWKTMARAMGLDLPEEDLNRTVAPLAALEPAFHKAAATLTSGADLAVVFDPAPEDPAA